MLGDSDLNVSVIGFGAWGIGGSPFWSNEGDAVSARAIMKSYDLGVNFFDTAPVYGFGHLGFYESVLNSLNTKKVLHPQNAIHTVKVIEAINKSAISGGKMIFL